MTIAICFKCGGIKVGALTACQSCGLGPATVEDLARSMSLTDRQYSVEELKKVGAEIAKTGNIPVLAERKEMELLAAVRGSPYLEMILNSSAAENRAVQIRNELGETFEEIKFLPFTVFNMVAGADGRINGREKEKFSQLASPSQVEKLFKSELMKTLLHFYSKDSHSVGMQLDKVRNIASYAKHLVSIRNTASGRHLDGFLDDVKLFAFAIAESSGGMWGVFHRVNKRELIVINSIVDELCQIA